MCTTKNFGARKQGVPVGLEERHVLPPSQLVSTGRRRSRNLVVATAACAERKKWVFVRRLLSNRNLVTYPGLRNLLQMQ